MIYSKEDLKKKLLDIHPEITRKRLVLDLEFDKNYNSWVISFIRGSKRRHAFLCKKDADECMRGNKCIYLWGLIDQYAIVLEQEMAGD